MAEPYPLHVDIINVWPFTLPLFAANACLGLSHRQGLLLQLYVNFKGHYWKHQNIGVKPNIHIKIKILLFTIPLWYKSTTMEFEKYTYRYSCSYRRIAKL